LVGLNVPLFGWITISKKGDEKGEKKKKDERWSFSTNQLNCCWLAMIEKSSEMQ
jgi:hypothetical protein